MNSIQQPLTVSLIQARAETVRLADDKRWTLWVYQDIMLWKLTGAWPTPVARAHFQDIWENFLALRYRFQRVFLLIDTDDFASQSYEFRDLVVSEWSHVLDREDLVVCLAVSDPMRRALRNTMAMLAGRLDKFRFYKSTDAALRYIQSLRRGPQVTSTPPEPGIADLMDQLARCHGRMAEQHRQDMLECEEVPEFEERFRELFREFPHAVFYFDLWGRFAWGNRNAEELFGYPMEELVGRAYFETEIPTLETLRKVARLLSEDPAPARGAPQLSAPAPRRLSVTAFRGDGARLRLAISHRVVSFGSKHVILCLAARSPVLGIRKT